MSDTKKTLRGHEAKSQAVAGSGQKQGREASKGQALLVKVSGWISRYMHLDNPDDALVLALWAMGTFVFRYLYTYPYLVITKGEPGCGASTLLYILSKISYEPLPTAGTSPAALLREMIDSQDAADETASTSLRTLLVDEAEMFDTKTKDANSAIINVGYMRGQTIGKVVGSETVRYPAYCPKVFSLIGAIAATITDRAVAIVLRKAQAPNVFRPWIIDAEGKLLALEIKSLWTSMDTAGLEWAEVPHLETRDQQIWGSLFAIANALDVDDEIRRKLVRWSKDNCIWKSKRENFTNLVTQARRTHDGQIDPRSVEALKDAKAVIASLPKDAKFIVTGELVSKMRDIDTAPWRGLDLDPLMLSRLLKVFSIEPKQVKVSGKNLRGYVTDIVIKASVPTTD